MNTRITHQIAAVAQRAIVDKIDAAGLLGGTVMDEITPQGPTSTFYIVLDGRKVRVTIADEGAR